MKFNKATLLSLTAGIALPFAFAPFYLAVIALLSPAFLYLTLQHVNSKEAFKRGFAFGIGFFGIGISWVYISIHVYGHAPTPLAMFITAVFVCYLSLFFGLLGYCLNYFFPINNVKKLLFAFPCLWVLFEALRGWLFTGFPWLFIGYSQTNTWLNGFAPLFGVYGLSLITVFISALLILIFKRQNFKKRIILVLILISFFAIGYFLSKVSWTKPIGKPQRTILVQGNIDQDLKWQPDQIIKTLKLYYNYTEKNSDSDLIIWPEAAVTLPLNQAETFLQDVAKLALNNNLSVITGIPIINPEAAFNGMVSLGNGSGVYHKRHLVPFGEYIPLKPLWGFVMKAFDIPMSNCQPGAKRQKPLIANGIFIAPYICYEVAYPLEFLAFLPQGQLLLTITDDSWFGHSIAAQQHLQMAQARAIETGRYLLFSGNTGITAAIDPKGHVIASIAPFEEATLSATVQPMTGTTPWMRWKTLPIICLLGVLVFLRQRG